MTTPTRASAVVGGDLITYRELPRQEIGVSFNDPSSRREWLFDGSYNRDNILTAAGAAIPVADTCAGVSRFFERYDAKEQGGGAWIVTAQYRSKPAYWELSITTTGGTAKMLQSLSTVRGYSCRGLVPNEDPASWKINGAIADFKRAIGVNKNGIEGVEVTIPTFTFQVNYRFTMASLSASYLMTLYKLIGKANDANYSLVWNNQTLTFRPGDLRFLGFPAKQTSDNQLDLTFMFSASQGLMGGTKTTDLFIVPALNATVVVDVDSAADFTVNDYVYMFGYTENVRYEVGVFRVVSANVPGAYVKLRLISLVGDTGDAVEGTTVQAGAVISLDYEDVNPLMIADSNPIKKKGWEYLWVHYEERTDAAAGRMIKEPVGAYVEQVLRYGNFNNLAIV